MTFEAPGVKIVLGDCMEGMAGMKDGEFGLAIVDPPYGMGVKSWGVGGVIGSRKFNQQYQLKQWDNNAPPPEYFKELIRVSKDQIIWGANHFNCFSGNMGAIIWDKIQPLEDLSQCEIASYSRVAKIAKYTQRWTNYVNTKETDHPTEKPVRLYQWLLKNYAKPGDRILDTHGGSMSSVIAANIMGYDITAYEIDLDYFTAGVERVKRHLRQGVLDL